MRICIDLDGVIAELKKTDESYEELKPVKGAVEFLKKLKEDGHYIIIYTSRHMKTCNGNIGKVIAKIGKLTIEWLNKYGIPYDELVFGKPHADLYIDDNAVRFRGWENLHRLPLNREYVRNNVNFVFVIPMAGKSSRFLQAGYSVPKYMIEVKGKSLFEYSIESLPLEIADLVILILLKEHIEQYDAKKFVLDKLYKIAKLKNLNLLKSVEFVIIDKPTRGQAETVLKAKEFFNPTDNLSIYNIDTYFKSYSLKCELLDMEYDGIIGGFFLDTKDNKWSFAKVGYNMIVKEVAEKVQISNIALTGFYNFTQAKYFVEVAEEYIRENRLTQGEFYIAPMYNDLIRKGLLFKINMVDEFIPLGTPEEVKKFEKLRR